jgi:hypothetical protein
MSTNVHSRSAGTSTILALRLFQSESDVGKFKKFSAVGWAAKPVFPGPFSCRTFQTMPLCNPEFIRGVGFAVALAAVFGFLRHVESLFNAEGGCLSGTRLTYQFIVQPIVASPQRFLKN